MYELHTSRYDTDFLYKNATYSLFSSSFSSTYTDEFSGLGFDVQNGINRLYYQQQSYSDSESYITIVDKLFTLQRAAYTARNGDTVAFGAAENATTPPTIFDSGDSFSGSSLTLTGTGGKSWTWQHEDSVNGVVVSTDAETNHGISYDTDGGSHTATVSPTIEITTYTTFDTTTQVEGTTTVTSISNDFYVTTQSENINETDTIFFLDYSTYERSITSVASSTFAFPYTNLSHGTSSGYRYCQAIEDTIYILAENEIGYSADNFEMTEGFLSDIAEQFDDDITIDFDEDWRLYHSRSPYIFKTIDSYTGIGVQPDKISFSTSWDSVTSNIYEFQGQVGFHTYRPDTIRQKEFGTKTINSTVFGAGYADDLKPTRSVVLKGSASVSGAFIDPGDSIVTLGSYTTYYETVGGKSFKHNALQGDDFNFNPELSRTQQIINISVTTWTYLSKSENGSAFYFINSFDLSDSRDDEGTIGAASALINTFDHEYNDWNMQQGIDYSIEEWWETTGAGGRLFITNQQNLADNLYVPVNQLGFAGISTAGDGQQLYRGFTLQLGELFSDKQYQIDNITASAAQGISVISPPAGGTFELGNATFSFSSVANHNQATIKGTMPTTTQKGSQIITTTTSDTIIFGLISAEDREGAVGYNANQLFGFSFGFFGVNYGYYGGTPEANQDLITIRRFPGFRGYTTNDGKGSMDDILEITDIEWSGKTEIIDKNIMIGFQNLIGASIQTGSFAGGGMTVVLPKFFTQGFDIF